MNSLCGPGFLHKKFGGTYSFDWSDWNLPLPPPADNIGYTTSSGIIKPFLEGAPVVCFDDRHLVNAILDKRKQAESAREGEKSVGMMLYLSSAPLI